LRLQGREPFGVRLLSEARTGPLEGREYAGRIEPGSCIVRVRRLGVSDALLRRLGLAFELGKIAVDGGELALDLGDARLRRHKALLGVLAALLPDLVLVLHGGEFGHALAKDGTLADLHGPFDAAILRHTLHALGVDLLGLGVERALVFVVLGGEARALGLEPRQLLKQRYLLAREARLTALRGGNPLLLLGDGAAALLHLLHEVAFDLSLSALGHLSQPGELLVVSFPTLGIKEPI